MHSELLQLDLWTHVCKVDMVKFVSLNKIQLNYLGPWEQSKLTLRTSDYGMLWHKDLEYKKSN